jgi:hypothetical protein
MFSRTGIAPLDLVCHALFVLTATGCYTGQGSYYSGGSFRVVATAPRAGGGSIPDDVLTIPLAENPASRELLPAGDTLAVAELAEPTAPESVAEVFQELDRSCRLQFIPGAPDFVNFERNPFPMLPHPVAMKLQQQGGAPTFAVLSALLEDVRRRGVRRLLLFTAYAHTSSTEQPQPWLGQRSRGYACAILLDTADGAALGGWFREGMRTDWLVPQWDHRRGEQYCRRLAHDVMAEVARAAVNDLRHPPPIKTSSTDPAQN